MAKVFIEETTLTAIGDAIRSKTGKTELIDPAIMSTEIEAIEAGGGDTGIPEEAFYITGNLSYKFFSGCWDWFIENYGNKVTTENINNLLSAFKESSVREIPFVLNVTNVSSMDSCFLGMSKLVVCPTIRGTLNMATNFTLANALNNCSNVRDFEDLFEPSMLEDFKTVKVTSAYSTPIPPKFMYCCSVRQVPSWWYKLQLNEESTAFPSTTYCLYTSAFDECYALDEINSMPVWRCQGAQTSNMFGQTFDNCYRVKEVTFETDENGQPFETKWKSQTIRLDLYLGHGNASSITRFNSGITADKEVKDDATYQALKNDPDWFTTEPRYGRYNHDSAVNTINSLPDTSAYLATAGGTNTIKFNSSHGQYTDGGAVQNLTAEEIAVAAAKGWTVSLS